jgi:hypothetical protein
MFSCGLKHAEKRQRTSIFFINKAIYLQVSGDSRQTVYNIPVQHVSSASGIFELPSIPNTTEKFRKNVFLFLCNVNKT